MNIGRLDRPIQIIKTSATQNTYGEKTLSTGTTTNAFARIEESRGKNTFDAEALVNAVPTKMTIRWTDDIDVSPLYYISVQRMGVTGGTNTYIINSIEEIGRREGLVLYCERKNIENLVD